MRSRIPRAGQLDSRASPSGYLAEPHDACRGRRVAQYRKLFAAARCRFAGRARVLDFVRRL